MTELLFGADLLFGAGLPTPPKRPTEGLLRVLRLLIPMTIVKTINQPEVPLMAVRMRSAVSAVSAGSGDPRRTRVFYFS